MKPSRGNELQMIYRDTKGPRRTTDHKVGRGFVLRAIIGVSLLLIVITRVDFQTVLALFRRTDAFYFCLTVLCLIVDRFVMAYKWNLLTNAMGITLSVWESFKIYLISNFFGILLPTGIGGDLYRIYHTTKREGQGEEITASVIMERFIGVIAGALFSVCGLLLIMHISPQHSVGGNLFVTILGVLILSVAVFWISIQDATLRSVGYLRDRWGNNWLLGKWFQCQQAYVEYKKHRGTLVLFLLLSLMVQGVVVLANYYAARAMGLTLSVVYFIGIIPICYLVSRIPISINSIGVREGMYGLLFSMVGVSVSESFSLALIVRLGDWLIVLAGGILYLTNSWFENNRMRFKGCKGAITRGKRF